MLLIFALFMLSKLALEVAMYSYILKQSSTYFLAMKNAISPSRNTRVLALVPDPMAENNPSATKDVKCHRNPTLPRLLDVLVFNKFVGPFVELRNKVLDAVRYTQERYGPSQVA